jgi:hypothetical protein
MSKPDGDLCWPTREEIAHPSWPTPRKLIQALDQLRDLKSFPSPKAVNTTTGPQLPKYVSAAFGSLDLPWKPGHLRSACGALCCHKFKPKNQTDDIFLAQILGHKLLGPSNRRTPDAADEIERLEQGETYSTSMRRESLWFGCCNALHFVLLN